MLQWLHYVFHFTIFLGSIILHILEASNVTFSNSVLLGIPSGKLGSKSVVAQHPVTLAKSKSGMRKSENPFL